MGSQAAFVIGNILGLANIGSLFTVGFGYGMGIVISLSIFAATSGGHFAPAVTLSFCTWRGFPWSKAPRYILSQILGAYLASLVVYAQWRNLIVEAEAALAAKGLLEETLFTPQGPAGIFGLYLDPGQNLGFVWFNEFITDFMLGLLIWGCLDPTNVFVPPPAAPWVIAMGYATVVWGFSAPGLAANTARDVGGRLAAMTIWGKEANGGRYGAITALTNIPATLLAATIYEFCFMDSSRIVPTAQRDFLRGHQLHLEQRKLIADNHFDQPTSVEAGSLEKVTTE